MYARQRTLSRYGKAAQPTAQSMTVPAPVGGINAYDSLMQMPPNDCIYAYNLMPVEYGLRLRKGYEVALKVQTEELEKFGRSSPMNLTLMTLLMIGCLRSLTRAFGTLQAKAKQHPHRLSRLQN